MKKVILVITLFISTLSMNAQNVNLGLSGALPVGDAEDLTSFGLNLDLVFLSEISEQFNLGIATGYHYYFGKDFDTSIGTFEFEDLGFLPLAAAGRINATENFTIGADVGYAIGINPDGNDGGFYYAPKLQYGVSESVDIVLAYKAINLDSDFNFNTLTFGLEFNM